MTTPPPVPPAPQEPHNWQGPDESAQADASQAQPPQTPPAGVQQPPAQPAPQGPGPYNYPPQGAPGGYGQPPYPPVPPGPPGHAGVPSFQQPRKSSKKGWIIGGSIAAVVLLLCCGCFGIGGWFFYTVLEEEREKAIDVVDAYLDDIEQERYDKAYDALCASVQSDYRESEFTRKADDPEDHIRDHSIQDAYLGDGNDDEAYVVKADVTRADDSRETLRVAVSTGNKVCSKAW